MPDEEVRGFRPAFKYYTRNGVTSSVGSAQAHFYRRKVGYNGPYQKQRPLPIHGFQTTHEIVSAKVREVRNWGPNDVSVEEGWALSRVPTQVVFDPPVNYDALYAKALERLNEKVRGGVDLSIDLAQAGQTAKMFKGADRLENYTKAFTRKWGLLKAPANAWLEYTYGIKPLVQSIYESSEQAIRVVVNELERVKVRANDYGWKPERVYLSTVYGAIWRKIGQFSSKSSVTLGIAYRGAAPDWDNFTSLNPISIAWELVPYSFVVDWVYDIGGYLRAVETQCLYANRFNSGYRTNFVHYTGEIRDGPFTYTSSPTGTNLWTGNVEGTAFERSPLTQYPSLSLPILNVDLGSSRLLSAASLLAGFLGRRPPGPRVI